MIATIINIIAKRNKTLVDTTFLGTVISPDFINDLSATQNDKLTIDSAYTDSSKWFRTVKNTAIERWIQKVNFKVIDKRYGGIGLGIKAYNLVEDFKVYYNFSTGSIKFMVQNTNNTAYTVSGTVVCNNNDEFEITHIREFNVFTVTVKNVTQNITVTGTYTNDVFHSTATGKLPRAGNWGFCVNNSYIEVTYYYVKNNVTTKPKYVIIGDSITQGYYSTTTIKRYANQIVASNYAVLGSSGDTDTSVIQRLTDIDILKPENVLILLGANGFNYTNYTYIIDYCQSRGCNVILIGCLPRNGLDRQSTSNSIQTISTIKGLKFIELYSKFRGNGVEINPTYSADGVHPNDTGHAYLASIVRQELNISEA
jgi:lysophospholipase L1-like esterase